MISTNNAIKELKTLALQRSRELHPSLPEPARTCKQYKDCKKANGLQRCIIDWLRFSGHYCERIAVTGRYVDRSRIVRDCLGNRRRIGTGRWIRSSMQKGSSDLSAVILGRAVKIEIKVNKDRQSDAQKAYQKQVEAAGALYWIVGSFEQFLDLYNELIHKSNEV